MIRTYRLFPPEKIVLYLDSRCPRKLRGRVEGGDALSGVADSMLRLCPALEARISDLRRDNTAAAQFLDKAQVFINRLLFLKQKRVHHRLGV